MLSKAAFIVIMAVPSFVHVVKIFEFPNALANAIMKTVLVTNGLILCLKSPFVLTMSSSQF